MSTARFSPLRPLRPISGRHLRFLSRAGSAFSGSRPSIRTSSGRLWVLYSIGLVALSEQGSVPVSKIWYIHQADAMWRRLDGHCCALRSAISGLVTQGKSQGGLCFFAVENSLGRPSRAAMELQRLPLTLRVFAAGLRARHARPTHVAFTAPSWPSVGHPWPPGMPV